MNDQLHFAGRYNGSVPLQVLVVSAGVERPLVPPANTAFDVGHMGVSVGNLAIAISAELFPEDERTFAATLIKRHFLTRLARNESWDLAAAEVLDYVALKRREREAVGGAASASAA